jgi:hypothetical protein
MTNGYLSFLTTQVVVLLALLLIGCKQDAEPMILLGSLKSGSSYSTVIKGLPDGATSTAKNTELGNDPNARISELLVRNFADLGVRGELKLVFWNDQLVSAAFYPENYPNYVAKWNEAMKVSLTGSPQRINQHVEALTDKDNQGRGFVYVVDQRLRAKEDDWIKEHS